MWVSKRVAHIMFLIPVDLLMIIFFFFFFWIKIKIVLLSQLMLSKKIFCGTNDEDLFLFAYQCKLYGPMASTGCAYEPKDDQVRKGKVSYKLFAWS